MGNRSRKRTALSKLGGRRVVLVNRDDNTYLARHIQKAGDLRVCFCGTGYTCRKHKKVDGRGDPPPQLHRKMRNTRIEWLPEKRRKSASRLPIYTALALKRALANAGLKNIATRRA